jgi:hypothetical protein
MGSICSYYIKKPDEEIIKDPVILAKIRNKEFIEYQKTMKPRKHQVLYYLNKSENGN